MKSCKNCKKLQKDSKNGNKTANSKIINSLKSCTRTGNSAVAHYFDVLETRRLVSKYENSVLRLCS